MNQPGGIYRLSFLVANGIRSEKGLLTAHGTLEDPSRSRYQYFWGGKLRARGISLEKLGEGVRNADLKHKP